MRGVGTHGAVERLVEQVELHDVPANVAEWLVIRTTVAALSTLVQNVGATSSLERG